MRARRSRPPRASTPTAPRASRRRGLLALATCALASLGLSACQRATAHGGAPAASTDERVEALAAPEPPRGPRSARLPGGEGARTKLELAVTWPASRDDAARALLSTAARAELDASPVPALVPSDRTLAAAARVVVRDAFYSVSARAGGIGLYVSGTRVAYRYAELDRELARRGGPRTPDGRLPGPHTVRGTDAFVTQNEGVWSASFFEHGASYVVELTCDDPRDARCADDKLLRALAEGLSNVGGRGASAPAAVAPKKEAP